jgi:hypothetical protein
MLTSRFKYDSTFFMRLITGTAFALAVVAVSAAPVMAQKKQQQQQSAQQPEEEELDQIELSQNQIDAFVAAQTEINPITAKLKGNAQPSKQMMSQMEGIAKKAGFKSFDEFGDVGSNIGMVFSGIDPQTKKYDPAGLLKQEVDRINADTKIPAKQKQQILKELQQMSTSVPALKYPANAELVAKNYDKLKSLMQ